MKPHTPEQFIGKTAVIARTLFTKAEKIKSNPDMEPLERCFLFTGPPGTGKTCLAEALAAKLSGNPIRQVWKGSAPCVDSINGQSCTIETVRQMGHKFRKDFPIEKGPAGYR